MKTKSILLTLGAAMLIFSSCMQGPKGEKARTGDELSITSTEGTEFAVNISSTQIEWLGSKPGGTHNGTFPIQQGTLNLNSNKIIGGQIVIDMNALTVKDIEDVKTNQMLVGHLKSPDFFATDSFPTAKFEIAKVTTLDQAKDIEGIMVTHNIEGNLTLRGITRSVTFPAEIKISESSVWAKSPKFVINRTNWKANYGSPSIFADLKDKFIHDEVALNITLTAEKK
jgi:polyisoprenoid-binding protein YceI